MLAGTRALPRSRQLEIHQFIKLYDEFFRRVYNYIRYRCGDAVLADDMTALTFERALTRWADYDPDRGPFGAWLFTIARNMVNNHLRSEKERGWLSLEICDEHPDQANSPEENIILGEIQAELLEALSRLNERERDIIGLKFGACLTNRRIAEITGLSESNVGVILYRSVHRLKVILEET
jgi:RNA polymerase sigma-70 factor (ECF subfamily)